MSAGEAVRLSDAELAFFDDNGYLVVENVLGDDDLRPLEDEYARLLDRIARALHRDGAIPSAFAELPFAARFSRVLEHYHRLHAFFNISLPLINGDIDPADFRMHTGAAVFSLLRHPRVLDVVECIVGPEIHSSPVQHMRMKPPQDTLAPSSRVHSNVGATTWHQDIVALLPEADGTEQLTVWIAVTDANEENGCLVCAPGSHRLGAAVHCANDELDSEPNVPAALMQDRPITSLPVKRGGVILFHKLNIHSSLPNRSGALRWSVDLRYHPTGQASGRPAFPGFVARSRSNPQSELRDHASWARSWDDARARILNRGYRGPIFAASRFSDPAIC